MKTETDRLILREMTYDDYDALYNVLADSDIMCHYPYTFDEKRVRGWHREEYPQIRGFRLRTLGGVSRRDRGDDRRLRAHYAEH